MNYTVISDYSKIDKNQWQEFVSAHPEGNVFQTPGMYEVYRNSLNHEPLFVALLEKDEIIAFVLALIQKEYSGIIGRFTARSIIYGGPLFKEKDPKIVEPLLKEYLHRVKNSVIFTEIRNFSLQEDGLKNLYKKHGFIFQDHLNILLDLKTGTENLWKGVKASRRKGINKADKLGFVLKITDHLDSVDTFYELLTDLHKKIKIPYSDISLYKSFNEYLTPHLKWFILEYEGKPSLLLCAFHYNHILYTYAAGSRQDLDFVKLKPADWFYWEVIKWSAGHDIHVFDWMGAGKPDKEYGVRQFKLEFGGETVNLGRYLKIHNKLLFACGRYGLVLWKKFFASR
jgi:serine/alanine adding enzyme